MMGRDVMSRFEFDSGLESKVDMSGGRDIFLLARHRVRAKARCAFTHFRTIKSLFATKGGSKWITHGHATI